MSHLYLWLKIIHIIGVVLFLGNIIITGWWKNMADRTKHPAIIAFAQRQVTVTDWLFTAGGSVILFGAAVLNVWLHNIPFTTHWIMWGMGLFLVSALIWAVILIPTQIKQAKMAEAFADSDHIPDEYWRLCNRWNFWGALAVIIPMLAVYWMVVKPV